MSYTVCNVLDLGETYTGATLNAQLYDSSDSTVGSAITTGFYERAGGKGIYTFTLTVPDGHQGWCDIYVDGASSTVLASLPINPAELENANVRISDLNNLSISNVEFALSDYGVAVTGDLSDFIGVGGANLTSIGDTRLAHLDADVSSRSTFSGGAVASVTGNVGGNVVGSVGSVTGGVTVTTNNDKTGYALSGAAIQAIWDALTSALTTVGSIGKLLVTNIDAAISSRLASGSYTTPPTVTAIRQEMDTNSTKLANLDAAVTTRAAASTALSTAQWTNGRAANLDNLDATVSSRATQTSVDAVKAKTDTIPVDPATTGNIDDLSAKIGNPDGVSVSADIAQLTTNLNDTTNIILALNNLSSDDITTAIRAMDIETGHTFQMVLQRLYALLRNNSESDDATNPTVADYYAPDGVTVRVHHDLTPTTRTVS